MTRKFPSSAVNHSLAAKIIATPRLSSPRWFRFARPKIKLQKESPRKPLSHVVARISSVDFR